MEKRKAVAAALVTVSLVGTLTWTAFAAKATLNNNAEDTAIVNTSAKNYWNLLSEKTDDSESESQGSPVRGEKSFRLGIGMDTDTICEILGITQEELQQKLKDSEGNIWGVLADSSKLEEYKAEALAKYKAELDKKVADGKITQEKADEIYAVAQEAIANFDGSAGNRFNMRIEDIPSLDDMPEDWKNKIEDFKNKLGDSAEKITRSMCIVDIDVICEVLGLTKEEFSQKLQDNDGNIYKILEDSGKLEEYKAAALAKYKTELDKKVADGKITQEKADEMYTAMKEGLDNFDGNVSMRFQIDTDGISDKIKEKFQQGENEDFTFNLPDISEGFGRGNKGTRSDSDLSTKDI